MRRAYLALLGGVAALAVVAGLAAHAPGRARPAAPAAPAMQRAALALEVRDGRVAPDPAAVPKGRAVTLAVTNRGPRAIDFRLAGYDERVHAPAIAPGATWRVEFVSDLPGEDFAWFVDGQPAGRLAVTGSHLVEGHR
jgi:hypothetical protein